MSYVQLSRLARLQSADYSPLPLIYLLDSIRKTDPLTVILSDRSRELACQVSCSASEKLQQGQIRSGDLISIGKFRQDPDFICIESMERLFKLPPDFYTFSQAAQLPDKEQVNVKARVVAIGVTCSYASGFGPKEFFNLAILDEVGSEVIVSFFNKEAVKFDRFFKLGQCYEFLQFRIDRNSPKSTADLGYSLTADKLSCARQIPDSMPLASFSIVGFEKLQSLAKDSIVDVAGVLTVIGDLNNKSRRISLVNSSNQKVEVLLWGSLAEASYERYLGRQPVVVVKRVQVKDPQQVGSLEGLTELLFDVTGLREAEQLLHWKNSRPAEPDAYIPIQRVAEGFSLVPRSLALGAEQHTVEEIQRIGREQGWGHKFSLIGTIHSIDSQPLDNLMYPACISSGCLKGVLKNAEGFYNCGKCQRVALTCTYRYRLRMILIDEAQDELAVTVFDIRAAELLGIAAAELRSLGDEAVSERINSLLGRTLLWKISRNKQNLHASQSYIVEEMRSPRRECGIE